MPSQPEVGRYSRRPNNVQAEMDDIYRRLEQAQADEREAYRLLIRAARLYVYAMARIGGQLDFPPGYHLNELTRISLQVRGGMGFSFAVHPGWSPDDLRPEPTVSEPSASPQAPAQQVPPPPQPEAPQQPATAENPTPPTNPPAPQNCREAIMSMFRQEQRRMTADKAHQWLADHGEKYKLPTVKQQLSSMVHKGTLDNRTDERGRGYGLREWANENASNLEAQILDVVRLKERASLGEILGKWPKTEESRVKVAVQEMVRSGRLRLMRGVYTIGD